MTETRIDTEMGHWTVTATFVDEALTLDQAARRLTGFADALALSILPPVGGLLGLDLPDGERLWGDLASPAGTYRARDARDGLTGLLRVSRLAYASPLEIEVMIAGGVFLASGLLALADHVLRTADNVLDFRMRYRQHKNALRDLVVLAAQQEAIVRAPGTELERMINDGGDALADVVRLEVRREDQPDD